MTSPLSALCLTLLLVGRVAQMSEWVSASHHHNETFISAAEGENLTLKCFSVAQLTRIHWYKQSLGRKSRLMYARHHGKKNGTFFDEFLNDTRFSLDTDNYHLTISNVSTSDSAFYYCVIWTGVSIDFNDITFVTVRSLGLRIPPLILQSLSKPDQPKDSVTLNCTFHTGSCSEEHSVYWFMESGGSQPGLIHTQGGSNDQCEGSKKTQTHTCEYHLPVESLNLSHTGTYYCAVAACGHIFFGNGTKLDINKCGDSVLMYCLGAALVLAIAAVAYSIFSVYKRNFDSVDSQAECSTSNAENITSQRGADDIHYAALDLNLPSRSRKLRTNPDRDCVYSGVNL